MGMAKYEKTKKKHHLFVWNCGDAPLFGFREDRCAVWIRVCVYTCTYCMHLCLCSCVDLGARFCTTIDGATKSMRQAECMVSACNIRLSSICVCDWTERTQTVAEPQQSANRCPRRRPLAPQLSTGEIKQASGKDRFSWYYYTVLNQHGHDD